MYTNHSRLGEKSGENKKLVESVSDIESYYESRGSSGSKQNKNNRSTGNNRFKNAPVSNYKNNKNNNENTKFETIPEEKNPQESQNWFSKRFRGKTRGQIMKDPLVLSAMALMAFIAGISIGVAVLVKRTVKNLTLKN